MRRISGLLDEGSLEGPIPVLRQFGPPRRALFVDRTDIADAECAIQEACQVWGGAASLLLPVERDAKQLPEPWRSLHESSVVDAYLDRGIAVEFAAELQKDLRALFFGGNAGTLLPVLASIKGEPKKWNPVVVSELNTTDPWHVAYTATLGSWPRSPLTDGFDHPYLGLRTDVEFKDFVNCTTESVSSPDASDLLRRIRDARTNSPVGITLVELARRSVSGTITSSNEVLPDRFPVARAVGPSVVVLYEPGSVDDMCLLWNLRWCFGLPYGAPLGIPTTADLEQSIREWMNQAAIFGINLSGSYFALTSCSVSDQDLANVAQRLPGDWRPESPQSLFWPTDRATRGSADVASFLDGAATLPAWHASDREVFHSAGRLEVTLAPIVRYVLESERLPSFRVEGLYALEAAYRGGGIDMPARGPTDMSRIWWPTGWEIVSGLLADLGLRGEASPSGRVAAGAIRQLGSMAALAPLVSFEAVSLLYHLAERRGTARFKEQVRSLAKEIAEHAESPEDQLIRIEQRLQELSLPASEDERRHLTFDEIHKAFGNRKAGEAWVRWAETSGLVLRGLPFQCDSCRRRDWKPLSEMGPRWNCRWCGSTIKRPFPVGQVSFGYAASATTLSLVGEDAITHVLAARWHDRLFSRPKELCGSYPGVRLWNVDTDKEVGEADVLLVFSDGSLVPGECKLRSSGWTPRETEKLDAICGALGSPWSFVATPQSAGECTEDFRNAAIEGPRPRFVLTGDQLFEPHPVWPLDSNPFEWHELTKDDLEKRRKDYNDTLPDLVDGIERLITQGS